MKRFFDDKFKANALAMLDDGMSTAEICGTLNITLKQLRRWETERKAKLLVDAETYIEKLQEKLALLEAENVLLKQQLKRQNK